MGAKNSAVSYDYDPDECQCDWMAELSDNTASIANLSIPGTNNTATWPGYGGLQFKCQVWPLDKQLRNGIRFLDVEVRCNRGWLQIYNGGYFQQLDMRDIIGTCVKFLESHPMEFILMRVCQENLTKENSNNYRDSLEAIMSKYNSNELFWTENRLPTVEEARGKVIILSAFDDQLFGIHCSDHSTMVILEDSYVATLLPSAMLPKWHSVESHLKEAKESVDDLQNKLFITFFSGSSPWAHPGSVAAYMNYWLRDFLNQNTGQHRWGVIVMDFPGQTVIDKIIETNKLKKVTSVTV